MEESNKEDPEIWKGLPGLEYCYEVSTHGNVRSVARWIIRNTYGKQFVPARQLKQTTDPKGYKYISIYPGPNIPSFRLSVHRMVAKTFINNPDPEHKTQVNHIDGNPSNNHVTNLEWVTPQENIIHAWKTGLKVAQVGEESPQAKLTTEQVVEARRRSKAGEYHKDIAKDFGVSETLITTAVNGTYYADVDKIESPFRADEHRRKGFKSNRALFTPEQVAEIKSMARHGFSRVEIAKKFNAHRKTIGRVCLGLTYPEDSNGIIEGSLSRPGFKSPSCKISINEMPKIMKMREDGMLLKDIAVQYKVGPDVVARWIRWYTT